VLDIRAKPQYGRGLSPPSALDQWRFRNPVLLSSHGNQKVILRGRSHLTNEDAMDLYQAQKLRDGREDVAERQSLFGQACLHRRGSDFHDKSLSREKDSPDTRYGGARYIHTSESAARDRASRRGFLPYAEPDIHLLSRAGVAFTED
jgi:hypothetical protein